MAFKGLRESRSNASADARVPRKAFFGVRHWTKAVPIPTVSEVPHGIPIVCLPITFPDPRLGENHGEEINCWPYVVHNLQQGKKYHGSALCTTGWDTDKPFPCNCCYALETHVGEQAKLEISKSVKFAIPAFVLQYFHKVPVTDEDGAVKLNPKTNEPYMYTAICSGRPTTCKHCVEKRERYFGEMRYLDLGYGFYKDIEAMEEQLAVQCACGGQLVEEMDGSISCSDKCEQPMPLGVLPSEGTVPAVLWLSKQDGDGFKNLIKVSHKAATRFMLPTGEDNSEPLAIVDDEGIVAWHPIINTLAENPTFDIPLLLDPSLTAKNIPNNLKQQEEMLKKVIPSFKAPGNVQEYEKYSK